MKTKHLEILGRLLLLGSFLYILYWFYSETTKFYDDCVAEGYAPVVCEDRVRSLL